MFVEELEGFSLLSQNDNLDLKGGKKGELAKKLEFLEVASQADKTLSQNYGSNSVPVVPASLMVKRAGSLDPITILYSWMERWTSSKYEFLGKLRKTLGSGIVHVVGWFSNLKDRIKCVFRNITASQASKTKVRSKKWKVIRTIGGILFNIGKKMIAKSTELMLDSIMVGLKKTMSKIFSDSFLSKEIAKISNWSDQFMGYKDKVFDYFDKIEKYHLNKYLLNYSVLQVCKLYLKGLKFL